MVFFLFSSLFLSSYTYKEVYPLWFVGVCEFVSCVNDFSQFLITVLQKKFPFSLTEFPFRKVEP
jgi:hypothetical protein